MAITIRHLISPIGKAYKAGRRSIEKCSIACAPGQTEMGAPIVTAHISAHDIFDINHVVSVLTLSPGDARRIAAQLLEAAEKADKL